ncbi:MAG: GTPase ObgE [Chloroflexota bacterium]|nr:GTPase ObgE [Chloroflexota bacterium]
MYLDEAEIYVESGRGGDGIVHFHREKYKPRGGPDGGDGGRGGDVILEVNPHINTLFDFRHKSRYIADSGKNGGPNNMTGKSAKDLIVYVPPGTLVYNAETGDLVGDLVEEGQQLIVAKGGRGGRGNQHFATSRNQTPRMAEKGVPEESRTLRLELKMIADVGIVGVPNAGKSSLLSIVSNAKPKIAEYPFTTLSPNLGVAKLDVDTVLVLADIPGLIEGAHEGVGLGFSFLRHIQRTKVLIHVLDGLSEDPLSDFSQINSEMALFDEKIKEKPQIVAFNKMDLPSVQARWLEIKQSIMELGYEIVPISTVTHENVNQLMWQTSELLQDAPEPEPVDVMPVYRASEDPKAFTVKEVEDGWQVNGEAIERAAAMTYWEHRESVRRFQRLMENIGVEEALQEAGVEEGDTVYVGEYTLEWQD